MAAPLSGVGQQQQVPLSQSLSSVSNDQNREVRQRDQQPRTNEVQARGAALNEPNETSADNTQFNLSNVDLSTQDSNTPRDRGSIVDITV